MYKGCVMQIKDNYAIVMTDTMKYKRIVIKDNLEVGKKIYFFNDDLYEKQKWSFQNYGTWIASVAVFVLVFNIFYRMETMATAVMSIDINPSVQLQLNKKNKIIKVSALNDEANNIIDYKKLKGKQAKEAICLVIEQAQQHHYLTQEKNIVLVSYVQLGKKPKKNQDSLSEVVNVQLKEELKEQQIEMIYIESSIKNYQEATKENISIGKYEIYKEKSKIQPSIKISDIKQMPVTKLLGDESISTQPIDEDVIQHQSNEAKEDENTKNLLQEIKSEEVGNKQRNDNKYINPNDNNMEYKGNDIKKDSNKSDMEKAIKDKVSSEKSDKRQEINEKINNQKSDEKKGTKENTHSNKEKEKEENKKYNERKINKNEENDDNDDHNNINSEKENKNKAKKEDKKQVEKNKKRK